MSRSTYLAVDDGDNIALNGQSDTSMFEETMVHLFWPLVQLKDLKVRCKYLLGAVQRVLENLITLSKEYGSSSHNSILSMTNSNRIVMKKWDLVMNSIALGLIVTAWLAVFFYFTNRRVRRLQQPQQQQP